MTGSITDSPWMTPEEVMEYSRTGSSEVYAALNDGSLLGHQRKAGGRWRVHRDDVDTWIRRSA